MKTLCNAEVPQHLSAGLLHTCLSFDVICAFPVFFSFFPSLHRTYLCVQVCVHMMSSLPGLCNACRMPTTSCTCPRNPTYPVWPPMPLQTPCHHIQQFNTQNPFFHSTSHPAVPMVSFYSPFPCPQLTFTLLLPLPPPSASASVALLYLLCLPPPFLLSPHHILLDPLGCRGSTVHAACAMPSVPPPWYIVCCLPCSTSS
jgi:hypothetical protein